MGGPRRAKTALEHFSASRLFAETSTSLELESGGEALGGESVEKDSGPQDAVRILFIPL